VLVLAAAACSRTLRPAGTADLVAG
jgi:hypothetical protein